jgi:hypothetical protein
MAFEGSKSRTFEAADEGMYRCKLTEVRQDKRRPYGADKNAEPTDPCLRFVFETVDERNSEDYPFKFTKTTGVEFGSERAALTQLVTQLVGKRLTKDEYDELDPSEVIGKQYDVVVSAEEKETGVFNNVERVLRVKGKTAASAAATGEGKAGKAKPEPEEETEEEGGDPFKES